MASLPLVVLEIIYKKSRITSFVKKERKKKEQLEAVVIFAIPFGATMILQSVFRSRMQSLSCKLISAVYFLTQDFSQLHFYVGNQWTCRWSLTEIPFHRFKKYLTLFHTFFEYQINK